MPLSSISCIKLVVCLLFSLGEKYLLLIQFVCFGWQRGNLKEGEIDPSFICLFVCLFVFSINGCTIPTLLFPVLFCYLSCGNILGKSTWRKFLVYLKSTLNSLFI
jgi:hypothetical protein